MFASTILEKNQRKEIKTFSRKCNGLIKIANYEKVRVKLTQKVRLKQH